VTGLSCSTSSVPLGIGVMKISDDEDDRVIEMTGGGVLLVTLVIDFYVNDDNERGPRICIHTGNDKNDVAYC
jgi:hypothetical protein